MGILAFVSGSNGWVSFPTLPRNGFVHIVWRLNALWTVKWLICSGQCIWGQLHPVTQSCPDGRPTIRHRENRFRSSYCINVGFPALSAPALWLTMWWWLIPRSWPVLPLFLLTALWTLHKLRSSFFFVRMKGFDYSNLPFFFQILRTGFGYFFLTWSISGWADLAKYICLPEQMEFLFSLVT